MATYLPDKNCKMMKTDATYFGNDMKVMHVLTLWLKIYFSTGHGVLKHDVIPVATLSNIRNTEWHIRKYE